MAAPQQQQQQHQHQPPPPDGDEWLDAQPFLAAVCGGMGVGELLHGPSFSLFESTTAIEIGDPKMDIGLQRGEESGSPEELIAAGAAPVTPPPPQLLAILDRLLVAEAAWHKGAMLPQTVFSSLYMLRPDRLAPSALLHAYCLALRSACSVFVDMAHAGAVTEDEDFFVHTFGIRMLDLPGIKPLQAALQTLAVAEEQLEERVAGGSSGGSPQPKQPQSKQQQPAAGEQPDGEHAAALLARIRFRRLVLEVLQSLQQYNQAGVEAARRQCQLADAQLTLVASSAALAAPLDTAPGFVPDINRRHMGLVPPRPVPPLTLEQAIEHWRSLLAGLQAALHSLLFVGGSWPALRATLVDFASGSHHAIVRSAMHLQLIKPLPPAAAAPGAGGVGGAAASPGGLVGGRKPAAEPATWCPSQQMVCREFGLTLADVPSPEAAMFVEQAAIAIQGQAYALCLNRCRQRRRLRRQLEDWRNIFDHGFNAGRFEAYVTPAMQAWLAKAGWRWAGPFEGLLQGQGPAATWAEREAAACALLHLQLGFPLDLYAPFEVLPLYWYCDYLLECQYRLSRYLHAAASLPPAAASPGTGKKAGGGGGKQKGGGGRGGGGGGSRSPGPGPGGMSAGEAVVAARELELVLLEIERGMCQGLFRSAIALQQLGCLSPPDALFNSEAERYDQRFGCMDSLFRPEALPFDSYRSATDATSVPPARVLASAQLSLQRSADRTAAVLAAPPLRALLRAEQVRHLEGVQRTATQNAVAAKLLTATAAAAAGGGEGQAAGGQAAAPAAASVPPFKCSFDFKAALSSSVASFYPQLVLKR